MNNPTTLPKPMNPYLEAVTVTINPFPTVEPDCSREELKAADVQITNNFLEILHDSFGQAKTLRSVCNLIGTSLRVMAYRRKVIIDEQEAIDGDKGDVSERYTVLPIS